jgi:hypothetical protein
VARAERCIVGPEVGDQRRLRPPEPVQNVEAFLDFLDQIEAVLGPLEQSRPPTTGNRFRL